MKDHYEYKTQHLSIGITQWKCVTKTGEKTTMKIRDPRLHLFVLTNQIGVLHQLNKLFCFKTTCHIHLKYVRIK